MQYLSEVGIGKYFFCVAASGCHAGFAALVKAVERKLNGCVAGTAVCVQDHARRVGGALGAVRSSVLGVRSSCSV